MQQRFVACVLKYATNARKNAMSMNIWSIAVNVQRPVQDVPRNAGKLACRSREVLFLRIFFLKLLPFFCHAKFLLHPMNAKRVYSLL